LRTKCWRCHRVMGNEADTCRKFVLPKLVEAGWDNEPHSFTEQRTFTDGRIVVAGGKVRRRPQKRADYLLRYTPGFLIAVIEAKAEYTDRGEGAAPTVGVGRDVGAPPPARWLGLWSWRDLAPMVETSEKAGSQNQIGHTSLRQSPRVGHVCSKTGDAVGLWFMP
jgi:hypothetical protein